MGRDAGGRIATHPEEDELIGVVLQLGDGDDEAKVVEKEELQLELVELVQRKTADLR